MDGGLIFFNVFAALISGGGLWLATRPTKSCSPSPEDEVIMKNTLSVTDLKGMFKAPPGVHVSIEEMRLGFERLDPWRVESLVMTEADRFKVRFKDGVQGVVRFEPSYFTGVSEALKDTEFFKQVFIEGGAVTWPGGIDLASEAMHDEIERHGEWVLR